MSNDPAAAATVIQNYLFFILMPLHVLVGDLERCWICPSCAGAHGGCSRASVLYYCPLDSRFDDDLITVISQTLAGML